MAGATISKQAEKLGKMALPAEKVDAIIGIELLLLFRNLYICRDPNQVA